MYEKDFSKSLKYYVMLGITIYILGKNRQNFFTSLYKFCGELLTPASLLVHSSL